MNENERIEWVARAISAHAAELGPLSAGWDDASDEERGEYLFAAGSVLAELARLDDAPPGMLLPDDLADAILTAALAEGRSAELLSMISAGGSATVQIGGTPRYAVAYRGAPGDEKALEEGTERATRAVGELVVFSPEQIRETVRHVSEWGRPLQDGDDGA